jgi:tetratricopeptide (TPR) repeat protein
MKRGSQKRDDGKGTAIAAWPAGRSRSAWPIPILILAGLAAYFGSFRGGFLFDDMHTVVENPTVRRLWPVTDVLFPPPEHPGAGRPIPNLTLAINYALNDLRPWGYHAVNLALHLLAGLALFGVARRTLCMPALRDRFGTRAAPLAFWLTLLWMVHPLQTESVTYITQRTELLMGLFYLLTLYCGIRAWAPQRKTVWGLAAVAACILGMFSKEAMVSAPLMVALYDRAFVTGSFREAFRQRSRLYAALSATWGILAAMIANGPLGGTVGFHLGVTALEYLGTQAGVVLHYLRLAVWPSPLVLSYQDWPIARSFLDCLPAGLAVLALLGASVWALRRFPPLGFLGAWFFLILAPTSSFVPIVTEVAAERRMYLPLASIAALVVVGGWSLLGAAERRLPVGSRSGLRWLAAPFVVLLAAGSVYGTVMRNRDYESALRMWTDVVRKRPNNAGAFNGLGVALAMAGRWEDAVGAYRRAIQLKPDGIEPHGNLGKAFSRLGRYDEAVAEYRKALGLSPEGNPMIEHSLGLALEATGRYREAAAAYRKVVESVPGYAQAWFGLGICEQQLGRPDEAIAAYRRALGLAPSAVEVRLKLAALLASLGRLDASIAEYETVLKAEPSRADARAALDAVLARKRSAATNATPSLLP